MSVLKNISRLILVAGLLTPGMVSAISGLTDEIDYACQQSPMEKISCDYRLINPEQEPVMTARIGDITLSPRVTLYPSTTGKTAVLFLIDTSDPRRARAIARNIEHVSELLGTLAPHHLPGLATFDSNLDIRHLPGEPVDTIRQTLKDRVQAIGKTTELYRNTLQAVKLLADTKASRKMILLLSDGQAEDQAYHHQDVISAALEARVVINTIGYAQSVAQSVSLQTLRRLSEESGGLFIATSLPDYNLPTDYAQSLFNKVDNGGTFSLDLGKAIDAGLYGTQKLQINLSSEAQTIRLNLDVEFPPAPTPVSPANTEQMPSVAVDPIEVMEQIPVQDLTPTPTPIVVSPPAASPSPSNPWIWYGIPFAFLLVVITALTYYARVIKAKTQASAEPRVKGTAPFAYLLRKDNDERFAIDMNPWRIGRSKNNEMTLHDESISRQHAEIHRDSDGKVIITDLESLNGIYVNDKKITATTLQEGDMIDLGDVTFQYSLQDEDYEAQMPTVIIKTTMP